MKTPAAPRFETHTMIAGAVIFVALVAMVILSLAGCDPTPHSAYYNADEHLCVNGLAYWRMNVRDKHVWVVDDEGDGKSPLRCADHTHSGWQCAMVDGTPVCMEE